MAGYSKRSLVDKLGIKPGYRFLFMNPPEGYGQSLGELPENTVAIERAEEGANADFIHFFTKSRKELEMQFPKLKQVLNQNGMLWISWPKKASKVETDVDEAIVRRTGLETGLVDVNICAVDDIWSGLKFVYRVRDRK